MTHGCLEITAFDDKRKILLHTYHTGMDIWKAVEGAITVQAEYHRHLAEYFPKQYKDAETCRESFKCNDLASSFGYQPSVAALVISAKPGFLKPRPDEFLKDLPKWSGLKKPWRLVVSRERWLLFDGEHNLDFNPTERLIEKLVAIANGPTIGPRFADE